MVQAVGTGRPRCCAHLQAKFCWGAGASCLLVAVTLTLAVAWLAPAAIASAYTTGTSPPGHATQTGAKARKPTASASDTPPTSTSVASSSVWTGLSADNGEGPLSRWPAPLNPTQAAQFDLDQGAQVDRYAITWWEAEPSRGVCASGGDSNPESGCDLAKIYDPIYTALTGAQPGSSMTSDAHPIRPVIVVAYAPGWAIDAAYEPTSPCLQSSYWAGHACAPTADHYQDYADFVATVAKRYPLAAAIEVWNEENGGFIETNSCCDATGYAQLLKDTYLTVHPLTQDGGVSSDLKVLLGGLNANPAGYGNYGTASVAQFLGDVYAAWGTKHGTPTYLDGIGLHLYPGWTGDDEIDASLNQVRDVRDDFGDAGRPIYITEAGISTTGAYPGTSDYAANPNTSPSPYQPVDEAEQAFELAHLWTLLSPQPDIRAVLSYTNVAAGSPVSSGFPGLGLLDNNGGNWAPGICASPPEGVGWRCTPYRVKPAFCMNAQLHANTAYSDYGTVGGYQCPITMTSVTQAGSANLQAQTDLQAAYEIAREYFQQTGSFTGFTNQALYDRSQQVYGSGSTLISATGPASPATNNPGPTADPSQIDIAQASGQSIEVCNSGNGDTSYCIVRKQTETYTVPANCSSMLGTCFTIDATAGTYQEAINPTAGDRAALTPGGSPYGWAPWAPAQGY